MKNQILCLVVSAVLSCKPRALDSQAKYGVPKIFNLEGTIYELLNKPDAVLKVCLFNENPNSPLGKAYLDLLEDDFREGLYSWLAVAAQHSAWKGPAKPKIVFSRLDVGKAIRAVAKFRQNNDPAVLAKINSYIAGDHKNYEESVDRYQKIVESADVIPSNDVDNLECDDGVSITGLTSKADAQIVQRVYQLYGELLFFRDEVSARRIKDLWNRLRIDALTDPKQKEDFRKIFSRYDTGGNVWNRAFARPYDLEIAMGLPEYTNTDIEAENFQGQTPSFQRTKGKWVMIHEIGHLFLLDDVYVEDQSGSALRRHPNALMGSHVIAKGTIQDDDKKGLLSILDNLASGKITNCAKEYKYLDNRRDFRASGTLYCIPNSPFQSQEDLGRSEIVLDGVYNEGDIPADSTNNTGPINQGNPYTYQNIYPQPYPCTNSEAYSSYSGIPQPQPDYPNPPPYYSPQGGVYGPSSYPGFPPQQNLPYNPCAMPPLYNQ